MTRVSLQNKVGGQMEGAGVEARGWKGAWQLGSRLALLAVLRQARHSAPLSSTGGHLKN